MKNQPDHEDLDAELLATGALIAGMKRPEPPAGLRERTLAHISAKWKQRHWLLRPITNPIARVAAAAAIMYAVVVPLADVDVAESIGARIEHRVIGPNAAEKLEAIVDRVLVRPAHTDVSSTDAEAQLTNVLIRRQLQAMRRIRTVN